MVCGDAQSPNSDAGGAEAWRQGSLPWPVDLTWLWTAEDSFANCRRGFELCCWIGIFLLRLLRLAFLVEEDLASLRGCCF